MCGEVGRFKSLSLYYYPTFQCHCNCNAAPRQGNKCSLPCGGLHNYPPVLGWSAYPTSTATPGMEGWIGFCPELVFLILWAQISDLIFFLFWKAAVCVVEDCCPNDLELEAAEVIAEWSRVFSEAWNYSLCFKKNGEKKSPSTAATAKGLSNKPSHIHKRIVTPSGGKRKGNLPLSSSSALAAADLEFRTHTHIGNEALRKAVQAGTWVQAKPQGVTV